MFARSIDLHDRSSIVDFLSNHFRYYTGNSWNQSESYANRVKLWNLDIPKKLEDIAWGVVCGEIETDFYSYNVRDLIDQFEEETGYSAGFNGRSGGYLVMYDTEYKNGKRVVYPYRSIDQYADFYDEDEWSLEELQRRAKVVIAFDQLCDNIRDEFINMLENAEIEEYEIVITTTHRRLVCA